MKKILLSIAILAAFALTAFAQTPQSFKYQAVARDANQQLMKNQVIGIRLSLLEGSANGNSVYSEVHYPTTSDLGVFSLEVGKGIIQGGAMSNADWGNNNYWLRVEMDPQGGNNFKMMGTSQLLSVPYALHAATVTDKDDADADPNNEIQNITFDPNTKMLTLSNGGQVDLSSLGGGGGGSDDQTLSLNGTILSIENGNSVNLNVIQDGVNDADADPNNEIQQISYDAGTNTLTLSGGGSVNLSNLAGDSDNQNLSLNGTTLSIEDGNSVDLSVIQDGVNDADADPTNELQNLTLANTMLMISNGNAVDLSVIQDGVNDADADPANEIQTLSFDANSNQLSISGGNTVTIPSGGTDADADPTNELQTISKNGATVTLSLNGGSFTDEVNDADADPNNELQNLILTGTQIGITNGNSVDLSVLQDGVDDADNNPTNELQTISKNGTTVTLSLNGGSFTDEVNDADADPTNELQNLSLQNDTLTLSGSGSKINLAGYNSPWKKIPNFETIEYKGNDPLARITNNSETLNMYLSPDVLNLQDTSEYLTYLGNSYLSFLRAQSNTGVPLILPAMGLNKDSLSFFDYDDDQTAFSRSTFSKNFAYLYEQIGTEEFTGVLEPFQLDMRINNNEAWGNYDAYGVQVNAHNDPFFPNNWEILLKAGLGMYLREEVSADTMLTTLTTPYGFNIGTGIGAGIMDQTFTFLNRDSLTFDYITVNGFQSGFASYGRDELKMNFQAGPLGNTTCLSPFNLCFETDLGGFKNRMDLTSDFIEFVNPNGGFSNTLVGLDSIYMTKNIGLLFPETVIMKPSHLYFEDQFNQSYLNSYGFTIKEILSPSDIFDRVSLMPDALTMYNNAKWRNARLGTVSGGNGGQLNLWSGTGDFKLAELGPDNLDPLGGSLQLFNNNTGSHALAWLRAQNGKGQLELSGTNTLNVYLGDGWDSERGTVQVYDATGQSAAGMYVTNQDEGAVWGDVIYVGQAPGNNPVYPFKTIQRNGFGINLATTNGNHDWEFYINSIGGLELFGDGSLKGTFSVVDGAYTQISDKRLKTDITKISSVLPSLMKLEPSTYKYLGNESAEQKSIGFIAQDVQKLFPELVSEIKDERSGSILTLNYSGFSVLAIKAIQEQQEVIEGQAQKIQELEDRLAKLEQLVEEKLK